MADALMLDAGPLGQLAHPRPNRDVAERLKRLLASDTVVFLPEVADYEVRRELLLAGLARSISRLNNLQGVFVFLPLTSEVMLRAAELWAEARKRGQPTADPKELDCDVILAAQAEQVSAVVVTDNVGHLSQFVQAVSWRDSILG